MKKKSSQKYEKEIKNVQDRLTILEKDYSSNFDFIDKCMILSGTLSGLNKILSFRQKKNLAKAIFKRIWVKDKTISKIELNPPFDFLLKDQAKKIHTLFPNLVFEHYPVKSTKKDIFEHLIDSIDSPSSVLVQDLLKSVPTHKDFIKMK